MRLFDAIFTDRWRSLPLLATHAGAKGYDHTLGDVSPEAVKDRLRAKKALIARLRRHKPSDLSGRLDRKVALGQLEVQVAEIAGYRRLEWDAALYPLTVARSLHVLMTRGDGPYWRRMAARRLADAPRFLAQGLANLDEADPLAARLTPEACAGAAELIAKAVAPFARAGAAPALAALEGFSRAVRARGTARAPRWRAGRELFEMKLRKEHGLPHDCRQLAEAGRAAMAGTTAELARAARTIDPRSNWRDLLERTKKRHPSLSGLLPAYRAETERARRFCLERNLVSFPEGESLAIEPTPRFEWDTTPYAAMLPPGALDRSMKSVFWVTPVDPRWSRAKRTERLEGHSVHSLPVVCPHEGYPGHHIQLARAKLGPSKARSVFSTPVLVEGWALYCEQMMEEEGFIAEPYARLYRLKDQLWRACRVVVDVGLHVEGWTPAQAVEFLVREALLERPNAVAEVNRYCFSPTQPMSYQMGKLEILSLRERCRKAWGPRYTLRRFHDWLLDFGSMPPSWIGPNDVLYSRQ